MARRAFVVLLLLAFAAAGCRPAETVTFDQELSTRIERLVDAALTAEDEAVRASALSAAREIFEREGIPSQARAGDAAAYGFVAVNMLGQPPELRLRFFQRLQQADA